jgi:hypothetical protein
MGERQSDGQTFGRRRARPGSRVRSTDGAVEGAEWEPLLSRALREDAVAAEAEEQVLAAFRHARDAGMHQRTRTRRRDDWRPHGRRPSGRSVKATIALFAAGLTLSGVAVAAMGSTGPAGGPSDEDRAGRPPSPSAPERSAGEPEALTSGAPGSSASPDRPPTAKDTAAHCRAYKSVKGRGGALDSTAWQRLITAAHGKDNVAAYCADLLARTDGGKPAGADERNKSNGAGKKSEETPDRAKGKKDAHGG